MSLDFKLLGKICNFDILHQFWSSILWFEFQSEIFIYDLYFEVWKVFLSRAVNLQWFTYRYVYKTFSAYRKAQRPVGRARDLLNILSALAGIECPVIGLAGIYYIVKHRFIFTRFDK